MNSFNHWAFGAVGEWMWRNIVGLNPDDAQPGWKHFVIAPRPGGGVSWAKGELDSIQGRILSSWRQEAGTFNIVVAVPVNASATIVLPALRMADVLEGGRPATRAPGVKFLQFENGRAFFELQSGQYQFKSLCNR
jgi:hypothetical protein